MLRWSNIYVRSKGVINSPARPSNRLPRAALSPVNERVGWALLMFNYDLRSFVVRSGLKNGVNSARASLNLTVSREFEDDYSLGDYAVLYGYNVSIGIVRS